MNFFKRLFAGKSAGAEISTADVPTADDLTDAKNQTVSMPAAAKFENFGGKIPKDILEKIEEMFPDPNEQTRVKTIIASYWKQHLNVGAAQLARAALVLSAEKVAVLEQISEDFWGDPRDVLMSAETVLGNPGHYCQISFRDPKFDKR